MLAELMGHDGGIEPVEPDVSSLHEIYQRIEHLGLLPRLVAKAEMLASFDQGKCFQRLHQKLLRLAAARIDLSSARCTVREQSALELVKFVFSRCPSGCSADLQRHAIGHALVMITETNAAPLNSQDNALFLASFMVRLWQNTPCALSAASFGGLRF